MKHYRSAVYTLVIVTTGALLSARLVVSGPPLEGESKEETPPVQILPIVNLDAPNKLRIAFINVSSKPFTYLR